MLEDDRRPGGGDPKEAEPAFAQRFSTAKASERRKVTVGKRYIELFHSRPVFKHTGRNALLGFDRDIAIEGGEEAKAVSPITSTKHDLIEFGQDFIDCLWGHGDERSLWLAPVSRISYSCPMITRKSVPICGVHSYVAFTRSLLRVIASVHV